MNILKTPCIKSFIKSETTIDYLSKKKTIKTNTNKKAAIGKEVFKEKVENIVIKKIVKLS